MRGITIIYIIRQIYDMLTIRNSSWLYCDDNEILPLIRKDYWQWLLWIYMLEVRKEFFSFKKLVKWLLWIKKIYSNTIYYNQTINHIQTIINDYNQSIWIIKFHLSEKVNSIVYFLIFILNSLLKYFKKSFKNIRYSFRDWTI